MMLVGLNGRTCSYIVTNPFGSIQAQCVLGLDHSWCWGIVCVV